MFQSFSMSDFIQHDSISMNFFFDSNFVIFIFYSEKKVMEWRYNSFFSVVVVDHNWLEFLHWRFVIG